MPGLFIVELFPPSESHRLTEAINRQNWLDPLGYARTDIDLLALARSGRGYDWWKLGGFANLKAWAGDPDARITKLPCQFDAIALRAVQIGESITAVAATFHVTEEATRCIDRVWQRDHQPELLCGKDLRRPLPQTIPEVAMRRTQLARQELHDAARRWLADVCPGFFAVNGEPQPLIDLLLFTKRTVAQIDTEDRLHGDAYRAIGLTERSFTLASSELPAMNLERAERGIGSYVNGARTWALWGERQEVIDQARPRMQKYGHVDDWALVAYAGEALQSYLLRLSISELLSTFHIQYAHMRDQARQQHGRFRMKNLEGLRTDLLALSLNIGSIERDIVAFNKRLYHDTYDAPFIQTTTPRLRRLEARGFGRVRAPRNTNARMAEDQAEMLKQLRSDDKNLRDVLSEAASLNSSMQALRISRTARRISAASLAIALVAVSVSKVSEHSILSAVVSAFGRMINWILGQ
ncbi:hypothetical protein A5662_06450 [Mycobacteriaceae bacterium 1482268.1]|nr:hypothetical protein A5662_06450 [Mycobacteriaceae bacterium 1482268.1]